MSEEWVGKMRNEGHDDSCLIITSDGIGVNCCACNKRSHDAESERLRGESRSLSASLRIADALVIKYRDALSAIVHLPEGCAAADAQEIAYAAISETQR